MENNIRKTDHDRPEDDHALALANLIDDDQPIDWESEAVVATSDEERAVLAELRVLAALTRVYRDPDAVGATEVMAPVDPAHPPTSWASLTILEQIGRGGFASVYRARDVLGRYRRAEALPHHAGERRRAVQPRPARGIAPRQDRTRQRRHGLRRRAIEWLRRLVDAVHQRPHAGAGTAGTRSVERRGSRPHRPRSVQGPGCGARQRARAP